MATIDEESASKSETSAQDSRATLPPHQQADAAGFSDQFERRSSESVATLGSDISQETFSAAFNLFRVSSRLLHDLEVEVHRPLGLSIAGFRALFTVWVFGELEPRQIALLSGVTRAAVSGVLNTLERDGYVERSRDQADRRLVTVRLSKAGETKVEEAYRSQNRREAVHFQALDADEIYAFSKTMRKLLAAPLE